jgi:DNA-binding GntR family transcriptional regulator
MPLQPVPRVLLTDQAYQAIRAAIVAGDLEPGVAVRDADLAADLGLSRAPVRAALARLSAEGLVESKPQSYTRITPLILRDVRDAALVVRAMHELAVREAVPRLTAGQVQTMRSANDQFAAAVAAGDVDAALAADDTLHDVLVAAAGNRAVAATIERYTPLVRRLERRLFAPVPGRRSVRRHARLIDACAAGDVRAAVAVTTEIWSALDEQLDQHQAREAQ